MPRLLAELHQAFTGDSMQGVRLAFPAVGGFGDDGGNGFQKRSNGANGGNGKENIYLFSLFPSLASVLRF